VKQYHTPDLYFERHTEARVKGRALERVTIDTTAFLGYATRGPMNQPIRVTSWKSFETLFGGFNSEFLLPQAVFSFFSQGGREAMILRVGSTEGENAARAASLTLKDLYGRPTLRVSAKDPGSWGRSIKVSVSSASRPARANVIGKLEPGSTEAIVGLTKGLEAGAMVRIASGPRSEYVRLADVKRKRVTWEDKFALKGSYENATVEGIEMKVTISSPFGFEIHDNLVFDKNHPRDFARVINESSNTVVVENLNSRTPTPFNMPQADVEQALVGGSDGVGTVSPEDFRGRCELEARTGLFALEDHEEVGMICLPDLQTAMDRDAISEEEFEAIQQMAVDFCERTKMSVAMLDVPRGFGIDEARDWRDRFDSKYAAMFYPWLKVQNPDGEGTLLVPPSGHVAGLTSQADQETGVHRAAANLPLKNVVGLERTLNKDLIDILAPEGINCFRNFRGRGIRPWGARTVSSNTLWTHINVRRLFIMVERSIAEGTEWAVFEPNNWDTWKAVERQVSTFLYSLWKDGMILGDVPEDGYYIRCDETVNTEITREAGECHVEIGIAAVRPAEFIVVRIGQGAKDIITEEPGS
jgi:phage tail sheath protein FI